MSAHAALPLGELFIARLSLLLPDLHQWQHGYGLSPVSASCQSLYIHFGKSSYISILISTIFEKVACIKYKLYFVVIFLVEIMVCREPCFIKELFSEMNQGKINIAVPIQKIMRGLSLLRLSKTDEESILAIPNEEDWAQENDFFIGKHIQIFHVSLKIISQ